MKNMFTEYHEYEDIHPLKAAVLHEELRKKAKEGLRDAEKFNAVSHELLINLSKYGWYINEATSITKFVEFKRLLSLNDANAINELMVEEVNLNYEALKLTTIQRFSLNNIILEKAFTAFESKQYGYAILIFLTQVDYISKSITGNRFFGRDNKQAKTKTFAKKYFNEISFYSAVLQPLSDYGEINKAETDFEEGDFNRHKIIHGEDTNYETEINAYKIISLIFYLATLVTKRPD